MQSTNYTCGPAALATVLQHMGITATEQEIAVIAGTDESGTTMYGLVQAAKAKGLDAQGLKISVNNLKKDNIVFLTIDGQKHYSVVLAVTGDSVKLADPILGNIELSLDKFNMCYGGYAVVISDPNNPKDVNGTTNETDNSINSTNQTEVNSTTISNNTLTNEEMQNIQGQGLLGTIVKIVSKWVDRNKGRVYALVKLTWFDFTKWCWQSATWTYSKEDVYRKYGIRI